MDAISIVGLKYRYRGSADPAVDGLNITIPQGSFFGLLGPNGAGKTTAISIICGLIRPNQGIVSVLGKQWDTDSESIRRSIGLVPQEIALYDNMTAKENLSFFASMLKVDRKTIGQRTAQLIEQFGLTHHQSKLLKHYSGGMKRRVNLMVALLHRPKILVLDEPTVGIDVQSRYMINAYLKELNKAGMTIIYTSHQLDETEKLCDRICIMDHGKHVLQGKTKDLSTTGKGLTDIFIELTGKQLRD